MNLGDLSKKFMGAAEQLPEAARAAIDQALETSPRARGGREEEPQPEGYEGSGQDGRGGDARLSAGDRGDRGKGDRARGVTFAAEDSYVKENLPPVEQHEIEFLVKDVLSYQVGQNVRSESKIVGNFRFRILVFPSGTQNSNGSQVGAFVEADPLPHLDPRWMFNRVKYQIAVINWLDYRKSVHKCDSYSFSNEGIDRGWHDMVPTSDLTRESGWLGGPDKALCVRACCRVRTADVISASSDCNFKRETGFIGLMNHGATCYMNGLLQSLFHLGEFRRIVYSIDCEESPDTLGKDDAPGEHSRGDADGEGRSPPLIQALQNVFYRLFTSDQAVNCRELMKSFGWDTMDAFTQHDAQELNRILCDRLEEQMKGSPMDGSIKRLFEGEMENYIECMDVKYTSRRNETFYDIQLNIKSERGDDLRSIEESLREFTTEEILEGENAYEAEGHGKQRAKKGIRFLTFPPVLNLQLKRFHFDIEKMDMVKLNTKFEFHKRLDLSSFAPGAGTYILHAVVVHSGDVNSGHYYAHIRPNTEGGWFKFDDDAVTPCSEYAAIEDNYGGADLDVWPYFDRSPGDLRSAQTPTLARIHNAYMLVYIKEDMADTILKVPEPSEVNARLVERCEREARTADQRQRERLEQQMKIKIRLVFDKDLVKMSGFWEHTDIAYRSTLKMSRDQLVKELAAEVEQIYGVSERHVALFSLVGRHPRQVRFSFMDPKSSLRNAIPPFSAPHFDPSDPFLMVLVCMSKGYANCSLDTYKWKPASEKSKPDELAAWREDQYLLLVVKYFCPASRKLVTLGCNYIRCADALISMVTDGWVAERLKPYVNNKDVAPLPEDSESLAWDCWEEVSDKNFEPRQVRRPVSTDVERLYSGDVVIWQPTPAGQKEGEPPVYSVTNVVAPEGAGADPPVYPVTNVIEFAAALLNAADLTVTLHDSRQPLCVDGVISNGVWGLPRPQPGAQKESQKEERPEDVALAQSPAKFGPPREQDLKMDLRWQVQHVTGSIARKFSLQGTTAGEPPQLWLFHAAPASTCEDPLNTQDGQASPVTLKDLHLQRSASYLSSPAGKKPLSLNLHAVEVPPQVSRSRDQSPLCIRFFDDAVREVGNTVVMVSDSSLVKDVLAEAAQHLRPEWGIARPLRALEVSEGRLHKLWPSEAPVRSLACFTRSNIFYHCLRVESDGDAAGMKASGHKLIEISHCDRQSQRAFAQPVLIPAAPGEKSGSLKSRCQEKLKVPEQEFKSWRLVRCSSRAGRTHLKDDEPFDSDITPDTRWCLEHVHPNPTSSFTRQSRYNKPLTIK